MQEPFPTGRAGDARTGSVRQAAMALAMFAVLAVTTSGPASAATARAELRAGDAAPKPQATEVSAQAVTVSLRPRMRDDSLPEGRWGDGVSGQRWTRATVAALRGHAEPLVDIVPRDIDEWCPAYEQNNRALREAFWVGLVSSLAKHESTWRPTVVGGGGRWHGLLQILPSTARLYGCRAQTGDALQSGPANLACGLRIMARTVARDGVVSDGMQGVAADWGPFHSSRKRSDMMAYTRSQAFCKEVPGTRPVARPEGAAAPVMAYSPERPASGAPVLSSAGRVRH